MKGTSEEGTGRGMDSGREEASGGGIERGMEGKPGGGISMRTLASIQYIHKPSHNGALAIDTLLFQMKNSEQVYIINYVYCLCVAWVHIAWTRCIIGTERSRVTI